jgi:xylulokinase
MALTLGIDASTQSVSAIVFDCDTGHIVASHSVNFGAALPQYGAPHGFIAGGRAGEVHADPLMWLDALELCLGRLRASGVDFGRITAISGAGQQHGTVYLNAAGLARLSALDPHQSLAAQFTDGLARRTAPIWMDTSTSAQCRAIEAELGGPLAVCARSGSVAVERFSGPQIRRFAETEAASYAATARIHLVSSFFASILAGADASIDAGDGAGMNLMNLASGTWDVDLMAATAPALPAKLPALVPAATVIGQVAPYFVAKYGFAPSARVVAFTGDNPSSLVGMGAFRPGKVIISLGTSDTFFAAMPEPLTDPAGCGHVFGNPLGGFMALQCFVNGSLAREQVRTAASMDWLAFSAALQSSPPGNHGNRMLPFFRPEISPRVTVDQPLVAGPFADNWAASPAAARACVEGQFLNMRLCVAWMRLAPATIYLTGGASQNDAIAQIAADVFQAEVRRLVVADSVALGGALRAGLATGVLTADRAESLVAAMADPLRIQPDRAAAAIYCQAAADIHTLQQRAKAIDNPISIA